MLDRFRSQTGSFITYLLFSMIIIVFVFTFGVMGPEQACGSGGQKTGFGETAGQPIDNFDIRLASALMLEFGSPSSRRYQQASFYNDTWRYPFNPFGGLYLNGLPISSFEKQRFTPDFGLQPPYGPIVLPKAMSTYVETLAVSKIADDLGLKVSNEELGERMPQQFINEKTGTFAKDRWEDYVGRATGTSAVRFEAFLRQELQREKLLAVMLSGVTVTDAEIGFRHRLANEKVDLEYVRLDKPTAMALIKVSDDEVAKWLGTEENKKKANDFYSKNKARKYTKPERVVFHAVKVGASASQRLVARETDAAKKAKLQAERTKAKTEADKLLQTLREKAAPKPAAPAAKPTDAAKKEVAKKPEAKPAAPKVAAKPAAKKETKKPTPKAPAPKKVAAKQPVKKAPAASGPIQATTSVFEAFVKDAKTAENVTGGRYEKPRSLVRFYPFSDEVAQALSKMKPGETSGVIEGDTGFYIVRLEATLPKKVTTYAEAEKEIVKTLIREKKIAAFQKGLADEVLAAAQKAPTQSLSDVVAALNKSKGFTEEGIQAQDTGLTARLPSIFGRAEQVGLVVGIGMAPELLTAGFAATMKAPVLPKVFTLPNNVFVVARLKGKAEAGEIAEDEKATLRQGLLAQKRQLTYLAWWDEQRTRLEASGDIATYDGYRAVLAERTKSWEDQYKKKGGKGKTLAIPGGMSGR